MFAGVRYQSLQYYQADEIIYVYDRGCNHSIIHGCRVVNIDQVEEEMPL